MAWGPRQPHKGPADKRGEGDPGRVGQGSPLARAGGGEEGAGGPGSPSSTPIGNLGKFILVGFHMEAYWSPRCTPAES